MKQQVKYPLIEVNISKIYQNTKSLVDICKQQGINIAGVIKGVNAEPEIVEQMIKGGCKYIASSRIEQLINLKLNDINKENMLIRIPMTTEIENLVRYIDISLNSELEIINKIELECRKQNKEHKVVIMMDLGDLREGIIDEKELIDTCLYIENKLEYVKLYGIGTNLSCYGSIKPTYENLNRLCEVACKIEEKINRNLDIVSGGATTSLPLVLEGKIPEKINNLRVGEAILVGRDLPYFWGHDLDNVHSDTIVLKAEIVELKSKPSHPIGEMYVDAFGNKPYFEDRGIRKRAILGVGKQDFLTHDSLIPLEKGIEIIGSSSDHLIVDIEDSDKEYKIGDIMSFELFYGNVLYLTGCDYINKVLVY